MINIHSTKSIRLLTCLLLCKLILVTDENMRQLIFPEKQREINQINKMISINTFRSCLFFYYFFIGCYIICVSFLLYLLIRLIQYYLKQKFLRYRTYDLIEQDNSLTTILVQIHNLNELPLLLHNNHQFNETPPSYKE